MQRVLGPQLKEARRRKRIKQRDLAARLGISAAYLNLIEHDKRRIAGRLLNEIVRELEIDRAQLTRNTETLYLETLQQIARSHGGGQIELDKLPEFIGRNAGWADLILTLANETESQAAAIEGLTEQLAHDPVLRETIHIILSKVTAIRSTSEILSDHDDMPAETRVRFCRNIAEEGARLTEQAETLLMHFDPNAMISQQDSAAPSVEAGRDKPPASWVPHYRAELEDPSLDLEEFVADLHSASGSEGDYARFQIEAWARRYSRVAQALPHDDILAAAPAHDHNPFTLARQFGQPVNDVMFRLAHMDGAQQAVDFGLIEVDNAGGVLFRKEIRALRLPTRSGACPRWPLYRALSQPGQGITAGLSPMDGTPCLAHAFAAPTTPYWTDLPPTSSSMMIYREITASQKRLLSCAQIDVGFHCFVCARDGCSDRRQPYQSL